MSYGTISEPPDSVRKSLPEEAQDIYLGAYNSAWEQYARPEDRRGKVAWAAVKQQYRKRGDRWVRKPDDSSVAHRKRDGVPTTEPSNLGVREEIPQAPGVGGKRWSLRS